MVNAALILKEGAQASEMLLASQSKFNLQDDWEVNRHHMHFAARAGATERHRQSMWQKQMW